MVRCAGLLACALWFLAPSLAHAQLGAFGAKPREDSKPVLPAAASGSGVAAASNDPKVIEAKTTRLFDFLEKEYGLLLGKNRDRVARSLLTISMNRVPREGATKTLLEMVKKESDPLVRAVAWECLISRAPSLTQDSFRQLIEASHSLYNAGAIRGSMRVALLNLIGVAQPDTKNKELFVKIFNQCDSRLPEDDATIDALGHCLAAWKSPDVHEYLMGRLTVLNEAFRAHRVLAAAGCPINSDQIRIELGDKECLPNMAQQYATWWGTARGSMKEVKVSMEDKPWTRVRPHLIGPPVAFKSANPDDKRWRTDLELRPPGIKSFEVGLLVDATGSMGPALAWLQRDVRRIMGGIGVVAMEPRIGLTFYRDHGDEFLTRHIPLTSKVEVLLQALTEMTAKGGEDIEEAVLEGLTETVKNNHWSTQPNNRRYIVMVCDAPPHKETEKEVDMMIHRMREKLIQLYAVKLRGPYAASDLSVVDKMATDGKGISLEGTMEELSTAQPRKTVRQILDRSYNTMADWTAAAAGDAGGGAAVATGGSFGGGGFRLGGGSANVSSNPGASEPGQPFNPTSGPCGRRVLTALLVDAINPQYADRVEPMVAVLWELLQDPSSEKVAPWNPIPKPTPKTHERGPGEHMKEPAKPPVKPKGPQER